MRRQLYLIGLVLVTAGLLSCGQRPVAMNNPRPVAAEAKGEDARGELKAGEFAAETLPVGKATRTYRLVVPKTVDLTKPAPLVVAFHGLAPDSKDLLPLYSRLSETAAKHRFVVVYPAAEGINWGIAPDKVQNDLAFFDCLVAKLSGAYHIDADRVYVVGMSNGGYFAHLVGKERSGVVAAVAAHSTVLGLQTVFGINAARKFPVLIIHGDRDEIFDVKVARENRDKYRKEGHEVKYVELPGVRHVWGSDAGVNETIWEFFAAHPRGK